MRLLFDHIHGFGKMSKEALLYYPVGALFDKNEYSMALQTGWFPLNKHMWFQCRSTRINLSEYNTRKSIIKKSKQISWHLSRPDRNIMGPIYEKYIAHRQYNSNNLSIEDITDNSMQTLLYRKNNQFIGFLAFKILGDAFLSVEFAWDYAEPQLSLGHISRHIESIIAKQKDCKYLYMSAGYEPCSIYKSTYPGFEWWTGFDWSKDVELYRKLCYSDGDVEIGNFYNRFNDI